MSRRLRVGAKLPHSGEIALRRGPAQMAAELEEAGFESLWVSDHVVFPQHTASHYPFAADGKVTWSFEEPYLEPMTVLGAVTASTRRANVGTSVLIAPMRNPVLLAKQAATIDAMSAGRLVLGVGAGWLREEFEALDADFEHRGSVLDEWMEIARACWTGQAGPFSGKHYSIPEPVFCLPTPAGRLPIIVGGMSRHALRRAGAIADGWLAQYAFETLSERDVKASVDVVREEGRQAGRPAAEVDGLRIVLRVTGAAKHHDALAARLHGLAGAGVTDVIVDVDWSDGAGGPARAFEKLTAGLN